MGHICHFKPEYSAIRMGADVVVQSLHKTLPAMTQTAVIHVCTEELVKPVEQALEIFLSSSPSYIFMMNMEAAICYMADHDLRNMKTICGNSGRIVRSFRRSQ